MAQPVGSHQHIPAALYEFLGGGDQSRWNTIAEWLNADEDLSTLIGGPGGTYGRTSDYQQILHVNRSVANWLQPDAPKWKYAVVAPHPDDGLLDLNYDSMPDATKQGFAWGYMWEAFDDDGDARSFTNWIKPNIDAALWMGCNAIKMVAPTNGVTNGLYSLDYLVERVRRTVEYCGLAGLAVEVSLGTAPHMTPGTTVAQLEAHYLAMAEMLHELPNVFGVELWGEWDNPNNPRTSAGNVHGITYAQIKSLCDTWHDATNIPITLSYSNKTSNAHVAAASHEFDTHMDYSEYHLESYFGGTAHDLNYGAINEHYKVSELPFFVGDIAVPMTANASDSAISFISGRSMAERPDVIGCGVFAIADHADARFGGARLGNSFGFFDYTPPGGSVPVEHWTDIFTPRETRVAACRLLPRARGPWRPPGLFWAETRTGAGMTTNQEYHSNAAHPFPPYGNTKASQIDLVLAVPCRIVAVTELDAEMSQDSYDNAHYMTAKPWFVEANRRFMGNSQVAQVREPGRHMVSRTFTDELAPFTEETISFALGIANGHENPAATADDIFVTWPDTDPDVADRGYTTQIQLELRAI